MNKLCKNCVYYVKPYKFLFKEIFRAKCTFQNKINVVSGKPISKFCSDERCSDTFLDSCGKSGRFYKEKDETPRLLEVF